MAKTSTKNLLLLVALLAASCHMAFGTLKIASQIPSQLVNDVDPSHTISYQLLNEGSVPYWPTRSGELYFLQDGQEDNLCLGFPLQLQSNKTQFAMFKESKMCSLDQQLFKLVSNGVQVAIVRGCKLGIDRVAQMTEQFFIPALCVQEQEAVLIEMLQVFTDGGVQLEYALERMTYRKLVMFVYIEEILDEAANLIYKFRQAKEQVFNGLVSMHPVYNVFDCSQYGCPDDMCLDAQHLYCAIDLDDEQPATGKQVAQEYLRELCIYSELGEEKYLDYIIEFNEECYQPYDWSSCGDEIEKKITQISPAKTKKFLADCKQPGQDGRYTVLEANAAALRLHHVYRWPSVFIQDQHTDGIHIEDIIIDACLMLEYPTNQCKKILQEKLPAISVIPKRPDDANAIKEGLSASAVFGIVALSSVITIGIAFFFYRRYMRKRLQTEMSQKVGEAVQQYMSFYATEK